MTSIDTAVPVVGPAFALSSTLLDDCCAILSLRSGA
jgi:hypothetical protein